MQRTVNDTVHIYAVAGVDGRVLFASEESEWPDTPAARHVRDQVDVTGVSRTVTVGQGLSGEDAGGTAVSKVGRLFAIDLSGDVPEDLASLDLLKGSETFPTKGGLERASAVGSFAEALSQAKLDERGCAAMPPVDCVTGVTWRLHAVPCGGGAQSLEVVSDTGFAVPFGSCPLNELPVLPYAERLEVLNADALADAAWLDVHVPASWPASLALGERSIEALSWRGRLKMGLAPEPNSSLAGCSGETAARLRSEVRFGRLPEAVWDLAKNDTIAYSALSESEAQAIVDAASDGQWLGPATTCGDDMIVFGRLLPAPEARFMSYDRVDCVHVDGKYLADHDVQVWDGVAPEPDKVLPLGEAKGAYRAGEAQAAGADMMYLDAGLDLKVSTYPTNKLSLALRADETATGRQFATLTVNIGEPCGQDEAYVDAMMLPGIVEALEASGIAHDTGQRMTDDGWGPYPLMRFDGAKLAEIDPDGYSGYVEAWEQAARQGAPAKDAPEWRDAPAPQNCLE